MCHFDNEIGTVFLRGTQMLRKSWTLADIGICAVGATFGMVIGGLGGTIFTMGGSDLFARMIFFGTLFLCTVVGAIAGPLFFQRMNRP